MAFSFREQTTAMTDERGPGLRIHSLKQDARIKGILVLVSRCAPHLPLGTMCLGPPYPRYGQELYCKIRSQLESRKGLLAKAKST